MKESSWSRGGAFAAAAVALLGATCSSPSCSGSRSVNALDRELLEAAKAGDVASVEEILARGAGVNAKDGDGLSPLAWAAMEGHAQVVEALLRAHADARVRDKEGLTPLHRAVQGKGPGEATRAAIVRQLLRAGADANARTDRGITPLMMLGDMADIALLLEDAGADVNARDGQGRTALMTSGFSCAPNTTRVLLEAGARKGERAANGHSAYDLAREGAQGQLGVCQENLRRIAGSGTDGGQESRCAQLQAHCDATLRLLE